MYTNFNLQSLLPGSHTQITSHNHMTNDFTLVLPSLLLYFPSAAVGAPFNASNAKCPPTTGRAMNAPSAKLRTLIPIYLKEKEERKTHSPVWVLKRSVKARFVGVSLIHFARREINSVCVEGEAIAAVHICQSARRSLLALGY